MKYKNKNHQSGINLFAISRKNLLKNDERIANERTRLSLGMLMFTQCLLLGIQLVGVVFSTIAPDNEIFVMPPVIYLIIILPFIVDPMLSCFKGTVGAKKNDGLLLLVGMIEFGYFIFELIHILVKELTPTLLLIIFFLGMIVYYAVCVIAYNISQRKLFRDADDD